MSNAVADKYGLQIGNPELASAGAIAFGPEGILFVADNAAATIFAIDVGDQTQSGSAPVEIDELDTKLGSLLGVTRDDVRVGGLAVHPQTRAVYLSATRGRGTSSVPVLIRIVDGTLAEVELSGVPFAQVSIADAPGDDDERQDVQLTPGGVSETIEYNGVKLTISRIPLRTSTVTDLAWVDGTLLVAGASNEEFVSTLRKLPFPFGDSAESSSLEIFHVSHGKYETASPIRTFIPFDGNTSVLASYTCTPVVHFPLADLQPGAQAKGRTVAELGAMNQPLDMISYSTAGEEYVLVSNTRHPLLKIASAAIAGQDALTTPTEPLGVPRDELPHAGVSLMANLGSNDVLMLQRDADSGSLSLHTYSTATL